MKTLLLAVRMGYAPWPHEFCAKQVTLDFESILSESLETYSEVVGGEIPDHGAAEVVAHHVAGDGGRRLGRVVAHPLVAAVRVRTVRIFNLG